VSNQLGRYYECMELAMDFGILVARLGASQLTSRELIEYADELEDQ
jgi:hypothetical protein